eukprot:694943-Prorocentrum_lima.AAC.1
MCGRRCFFANQRLYSLFSSGLLLLTTLTPSGRVRQATTCVAPSLTADLQGIGSKIMASPRGSPAKLMCSLPHTSPQLSQGT